MRPTHLADSKGTVFFSEISIDDSRVMITDEVAGNVSPETLGGSPVRLVVYVPDVDAVMERAVAAGGTTVIPAADQFYDDWSARLQDPFGHLWVVQAHKEGVSPEDMQRRMTEMFGA